MLLFLKNAIILKNKNVAITPEKQLDNQTIGRPEQGAGFDVKEAPEKAKAKEISEREPEKKDEVKKETEKKPLFRKPKVPVLPIKRAKDEIEVKVEKIMEEGLKEAFEKMSPIAQQEFKIKGEETAQKISQLLKKTHIKVKKIFALLFDWLKMIPGVNYFFLEQEAKIKADKIIALKNNLQK